MTSSISSSSTSQLLDSPRGKPLSRTNSTAAATSPDLVEVKPLSRRSSTRQEFITIAETEKFADMGTTSELSLASSPEAIARFLAENSSRLHTKQFKCLLNYATRNLDPSLLKIWSIARRRLRVRFAEKATVFVVWRSTDETQMFKVKTEREVSIAAKIREFEPEVAEFVSDEVFSIKYLLENEQTDVDSFIKASKNKFISLAKEEKNNLLDDIAKKCSAFICLQLRELMDDHRIFKANDPGELLLKTVKENNISAESIDKSTFAALVKGTGLPMDLLNAPEYRKASAAYRDQSWKEDEEKEIRFTKIDSDAMVVFEQVIKKFFLDPEVIEAFQIQKKIFRKQRKF